MEKHQKNFETTLRLPPALHAQLKHIAIDMHATQEEVVEMLVQRLIETNGAILDPPKKVEQNHALAEKLRVMLASGDLELIETLERAINLLHSCMRRSATA